VQIQRIQTCATGENGDVVQALQELEGMCATRETWRIRKRALRQLIVSKGRASEAGLEYVRKLRDAEYNETIFNTLVRYFQAAKLDEAKQDALIQVIDHETTPEGRSFPKRSLIVVGVTLLGFRFAVCIVLPQASFRHPKENPVATQKLAILRRMLSV
jgi:hypothetical protein